MPIELQEIVEKLDVVPEEFRDLYQAQDDGKFKIDVKGFTKNYRTLLGQKKTLDTKFKDVDVDDYRRLKEEEEQRKEEEKKAKGKKKEEEGHESEREKSLIEKHKKELKAKEDDNTSLLGQLEKHVVEAAATREISEAKGRVKVLLPHVMRRLKMVKDDNQEYTVIVLDPDTGEEAVKDGRGGKMTIKDLVQEFKRDKEFASNFEADTGSGSGSSGAGRGNTGKADASAGGGESDISKLNPTERLKVVRRAKA